MRQGALDQFYHILWYIDYLVAACVLCHMFAPMARLVLLHSAPTSGYFRDHNPA
jgi:hypothetical protein